MAKKTIPVPWSFEEAMNVTVKLRAPQLRRINTEIKELNRLNGEITKSTNNMGFVFMGNAYADEDHAQIAGKNYTASGVSWPQLHLSLWDRGQALVKMLNQLEHDIALVRQYLGLVLAANELDKYAKRNCIPDYISGFMESLKAVPRSEPIEDAVGRVPRINIFYKKVEQTMAVLAAGQLIY